jgi:hypothetical protein
VMVVSLSVIVGVGSAFAASGAPMVSAAATRPAESSSAGSLKREWRVDFAARMVGDTISPSRDETAAWRANTRRRFSERVDQPVKLALPLIGTAGTAGVFGSTTVSFKLSLEMVYVPFQAPSSYAPAPGVLPKTST